jgi:hypothetical protein
MPIRGKHCVPLALWFAYVIIGCADGATAPQTGAIQASLHVEGAPPDVAGLLVTVDDTISQRLLDGESCVFGRLTAGPHTVAISDVPTNCSVQGEPVRPVTVSANHTVVVPFSVDCPAPGSIEVRVRTAGSNPDPDCYAVVLDGATTRPIGVNGLETFADLPVGEHDVELTGIAGACLVPGTNPIAVTVLENDPTRVDFGVACPPFYDHIAFLSNRDGGSSIFVMESDGSNAVNLTAGTRLIAGEPYPTWSPDATSIAFTGGEGWPDTNIHILNTVDLSVRQITSSGSIGLCDWSPDGMRLVYSSNGDVYVIDMDGSNPVNLTPGPAWATDPAWSPDGSQIAFAREDNIWVMVSDGSDARQVTDLENSIPGAFYRAAYEPAWSPDGERIAFAAPGEQATTAIWVVGSDGSNLTRLTPDLLATRRGGPAGRQTELTLRTGPSFQTVDTATRFTSWKRMDRILPTLRITRAATRSPIGHRPSDAEVILVIPLLECLAALDGESQPLRYSNRHAREHTSLCSHGGGWCLAGVVQICKLDAGVPLVIRPHYSLMPDPPPGRIVPPHAGGALCAGVLHSLH